MIIFYMCS